MGEVSTGDYQEMSMLTSRWREAEKTVGLKWSVLYVLKDNIKTCHIASNKQEQRHEIWIHPNVLQNPELFEVDVLHELCHAKLAESTDPLFATTSVSEKYKGLEGEKDRILVKKLKQLGLACLHIDMWVNDLRHEYWPELTRKDIVSCFDGIKKIAKSGDDYTLGQIEMLIAIAMNIAAVQRNMSKKKRPKYQSTLALYDTNSRVFINKLANYFKSLPRLTGNIREDLAILEESVQHIVNVFDLQIDPKILEENGEGRWDLGKI